jgi:hypothetical protein
MAIFNYIFYRFLQTNIHKPIYWAKIFVPVIEILIFLPASLTLVKYSYGCSVISEKAIGMIGILLWLLVWLVNSYYYSPSRIRKIIKKYSEDSRLMGNIKLLIICLLLISVFMLADDLIKLFIEMPDCHTAS